MRYWPARTVRGAALAGAISCALIQAAPIAAQDGYAGYEEQLAQIRAEIEATVPEHEKAYGHAQAGLLLVGLNRVSEAEQEIAKGKAYMVRVFADENAPEDAIISHGELLYTEAFLFQREVRYAECEAHMREARPIYIDNYGDDHPYLAMVETLLAGCLARQGEYAEAIEFTLHIDEIFAAQGPEYGAQRVNALLNLSNGLQAANRMVEAEQVLRKSLIPARTLPEMHPARYNALRSLGAHLVFEGRAREGMNLLREALEDGANNPAVTQDELGVASASLAGALLRQDRPLEALDVYQQALAQIDAGNRDVIAASTRIAASVAADRAEQTDLALQMAKTGVERLLAAPESGELRLALARLAYGALLVRAGRLDEAADDAAEIAEILTRTRSVGHASATAAQIQSGWMMALQGQTEEGLEKTRSAFNLSLESRRALEYARNRSFDTLPAIVQYSQALEVAQLAGDDGFAFQVMQAIIQSDASRAAFAVAARESAADTQLGALLRQRQEAGEAVASADALLLQAEGEDSPEIAQLSADLAIAQAALIALDEELDARFPSFRELIQPRAASLAQMRETLDKDEALLVVAESDLGVYTLAVTRDGSMLSSDPIRRESLRQLVGKLRANIDEALFFDSGSAGGQGLEPEPFDIASAARLHDIILPEDMRKFLRRKSEFLVATGDILSALPLSILVSKAGEGVTDSRFLIEDKALSVVPSFAALVSGRTQNAQNSNDRQASETGGGLVAIGAPDLGGSGKLAAASDYFEPTLRSARMGDLAPLPGALAEMQAVASLLSDRGEAIILSGAAANEPAVRQLDLRNIGVLLFATHGLVAGSLDGQGEPALVLTPPAQESEGNDGLFTASEASALDIGADWVILSACDTAAGGRASAAGYTGLARGFLFAGAKRVVASHWPVRDDISARLSIGIISSASNGASSAAALREAVLAVKKDEAHPALWGPFMVVSR